MTVEPSPAEVARLSAQIRVEVNRLKDDRGFSAQRLAKLTGIPRTSMQRKLDGASPFDFDDAQELCRVFEVDILDLITWARR